MYVTENKFINSVISYINTIKYMHDKIVRYPRGLQLDRLQFTINPIKNLSVQFQ